MSKNGFGPQRISVELTNICNLHCSYCLRDEDALYHTPANFLAPDLLERIIIHARESVGVTSLVFTGGEPTLHPDFKRIIKICEDSGVKASFVTNGWHFERIWPTVLQYRDTVTHVGFSLDGVTEESHDGWRGKGSFVRLVRAFARCFAAQVPFVIKVGIRRDTINQLEQIALFSARLGATALNFAHIMPTSKDVEDASALTYEERQFADQEIANLARIFKMEIGIDVGYHNLDPAPPCSALAGVSSNIDYKGRLSLCCNLSGFRGANHEPDVVADLNTEDFTSAFQRLSQLAVDQLSARRERLAELKGNDQTPDPYVSSPCLFCLDTFGKLPWREPENTRSLPVFQPL